MQMRSILFLCSFLFFKSAFDQVTLTDSIYTGGMYRNYILYIPEAYDGSEAVPLVFNLHGYSSNNTEQYYYADFRSIADTANFIIALPNGTIDGFGLHFWNCFAADETGVDDVAFISALIDTISAEYQVDANRIYSTGMSNGGFMSYTLAGELSNRIAAIASVAGSVSKVRFAALDPQHLTPVMEIHGNADGVVPYNGSSDFLPVDSVQNYWINFNGCSPDPTVTPVPDINTLDGCTAEHYVYGGAANGTTVELFKVEGGGHTWPGTIFSYIGVTNEDFSACAEIWKFFSRYSLDALTPLEENYDQQKIPLEFYPNPFSNTLEYHPENANAITSVIITDVLGNIVFSGDCTSGAISTASWNSGVYCIKTLNNGVVSEQKVVKQ